MPDYFVLTQLIIDDLHFPDHRAPMPGQLGGGVYAVAGMRTWSDSVGFCCAVGPDYAGNYDSWFLRNRVEVAAAPREKKCVHSTITYFEDGERSEEPQPGYGNFTEMMPQVSEIPASWKHTRGMYFYKDCDPAYWDSLKGFLKAYSGISCWEIDSFYATWEHRDEIGACLESVDLFSTNLTEGRRMTGKEDPAAIAKGLLDLGAKNLILRLGAKGAITADRSGLWAIPAAPTVVVDVTGGGNSSTGGFVTGFCETGGDLAKAGIMAGVSASFIIRQYGVPADMDSVMEKASVLADQIHAEKL